jgi:hypothetical protein
MKNTKQNFFMKIIFPLLTIGLFLLYYIYSLPIFYFKLIIIIILISLNIYFLLNDRNNLQEQKDSLVSGFPGISTFRKQFQTIGAVGSLYSTYLALKGDYAKERKNALEAINKKIIRGGLGENKESEILKLQHTTTLTAKQCTAVEHVETSHLQLTNFLTEIKELSV